jgi:MFS transporter, DHA1 family, multidrug resistance protein
LPLRTALRSRAYQAALAAGFVGDFSLVGARSSLVPQYVTDHLGLASGWVYAPFLVVSIVSGALLMPTGRVADSVGRRPVIAVGLVIGAVGLALMPALPTATGVILGAVLIGVGAASDSVAPGAVMGDVVGAGGGTVVAVFQMAGDLGAVLGPVVCGLVVDHGGYAAALLVAAGVCLVPLVLLARAPETLTAAPARAVEQGA